MADFSTALASLIACKTARADKNVHAIFTELELLSVQSESWPKGFFEELVKLLDDDAYLGLKDSWMLVHFLNNNWEELSDHQSQGLRDVLARAFDKYQDWTGAFVTSEVLGERYPDRATLAILRNLGQNARLPARAAVAHGLETLAKTSSDESLKGLAVNVLRDLEASTFPDVRKEALISLRKLGISDGG
jgi:hypothetical protein